MAAQILGKDNTGDPGPFFKVIVHLCGLAAIAGIFLPFIGGSTVMDLVQQLRWAGFGSLEGQTIMGTVTSIVLTAGFVLFPLIGIVMAIRGKYAGGPFTFLLLYNLAAFLLVLFYGAEVGGLVGNFFVNTGLGYWISCGALLAPFLAMFFLDKSI
jgi:hypothetical protein